MQASQKEWWQVNEADVQHFLNLVSDPVIEAFHIHDVCRKSSDRFLLAMVFVYFKKGYLTFYLKNIYI